jgi:hypothetical protein
MSENKFKYFNKVPFFVFLLLFSVVTLTAQSGGTYAITQSVTSNGGGQSQGGTFTVEGTAGQAAAGTDMSAPPYTLKSGFWTPAPFAPTAAGVTVGGRVVKADGFTGIRNITVSLTNGTFTAPRIARTNALGYFTFENVEAGQFYIISVSHKNYAFAQNSQGVMVLEELTDIVFQADWGTNN